MTDDGSLIATAVGYLAAITAIYVVPAYLYRVLVEHRRQIAGWWHSTRVAEAMRWRRDGCSWSVAWVRSGANVHDDEPWPHLGTGVRR